MEELSTYYNDPSGELKAAFIDLVVTHRAWRDAQKAAREIPRADLKGLQIANGISAFQHSAWVRAKKQTRELWAAQRGLRFTENRFSMEAVAQSKRIRPRYFSPYTQETTLFDHQEYLNRDGKPALIITHSYAPPRDFALTAPFLRAANLKWVNLGPYPSWYFPGGAFMVGLARYDSFRLWGLESSHTFTKLRQRQTDLTEAWLQEAQS